MNKLFISIILLILLSLNSYSQKSNLERFEVNLISGCAPLEVQIVDENVDSTATVIQYDFNYNNLSFNPSLDICINNSFESCSEVEIRGKMGFD